MPDPARNLVRDRPARGADSQWNGSRGADARSRPANGLRRAVYTDSAGGFPNACPYPSTQRHPCTDWANASSPVVNTTLNSWRVARGTDPDSGTGQRGAGGCRRRSAGLAAAARSGRRPRDSTPPRRTGSRGTAAWTCRAALASGYTPPAAPPWCSPGCWPGDRWCRWPIPADCGPAMSRSGRPWSPVSR